MIENFDIICFSPSDWWGMNPSSAMHIMKRLAEKNRILYINPFSSDLLGEKKGMLKRIPRKVKSISKWMRNPQRNLFVFSPIFLPFHGIPFIDNLNNVLLRKQILSVCKLIGIKRPILWVENLRAADMLDWFDSRLIIYHVSDLFTESRYIVNKQKLQERENRVIDKSNLLICVSKSIHNVKSAKHANVHYLPHGVDYKLFREATEKRESAEEVIHIKRPIAGYFGTMTANNDIELIEWCARRLPEVSFVLAGQITSGDYSELSSISNVHLIGKIPYEKIPSLCASFNVCMLQWKMSKWIEYCNPLKMFEYMASGKPIVSVPIKEAMKYSDIISIAYSKEQFAGAIRWELLNDTPERVRRRIAIAREHSWDNHIIEISQLIINTMATQGQENKEALLGPQHI
jgi:glycosyltransferase involved in cell wall biosynthesis